MIEERTISLSLDGDQWLALLGENIQEGICGFGDSPKAALLKLAEQLPIKVFQADYNAPRKGDLSVDEIYAFNREEADQIAALRNLKIVDERIEGISL
jgi:hypothetical protein